MEMKTVDVTKLEGKALDWAVAAVLDFKFDEGEIYIKDGMVVTQTRTQPWRYWEPSRSWSQGGPLIEKHKIDLVFWGSFGWFVPEWMCNDEIDNSPELFSETPLIAACRAIVINKLGNIVQVPAELVT